MATASTIKFGDGLDVTDEGAGVIRVDLNADPPVTAADVTADSTTLVGTGTNVQAVLEELDNGIADHLADAAAAHAASAISYAGGTGMSATDVEAAIDELATEKADAINFSRCRATGDHAISSATETDVTGMGLVLAASSVYSFEYVIRCSSNATTVGIQYYLTFGGNITRCDANLDYYITVSAKGSVDVVNDTSSPITFEPLVSQGNVVLLNRIVGTIEVGAAGGTLQLQHGSETATLTTVFRGSYGIAWKH